MKRQITVENEAQMSNLGHSIGSMLTGGEKIALIGTLGAGKTTLAKAILAGAGVSKKGFSPTFILDAVYKVSHKKFKEMHHFDLYRLKDEGELITLGISDIVEQQDVVIMVEWADLFEALPPNDHLAISIDIQPQGRIIKLSAHGKRYEDLIESITHNRT